MRPSACALVVSLAIGPALPGVAATAFAPPSKPELEAARKLLETYVPPTASQPTLWAGLATGALLEGQPAIAQAAIERAAAEVAVGEPKILGKAVARTWLEAAQHLYGDPSTRKSSASLVLLYVETAVRLDPDLAGQEAGLVTEAPKTLAAAKDSPRPGVPTEADLKLVIDRSARELERVLAKAKPAPR